MSFALVLVCKSLISAAFLVQYKYRSGKIQAAYSNSKTERDHLHVNGLISYGPLRTTVSTTTTTNAIDANSKANK